MAFSPTSPVTGATVTGLTSPTYTLVADQALNHLSKQWYVSALGGTQAGVSVHSASAPFTVSVVRPQVVKTLQAVDPVTGLLRSVERNRYSVHVRKGVIPLVGQPAVSAIIRCELEVPAGSEIADTNSIAAMISMAFGALSQQASGLLDTAKTGSV